MPTIKEIAKACNVSVATVSNIINHKGSVGDATRERVEQVIREMNYTPNYVAKNLKNQEHQKHWCHCRGYDSLLPFRILLMELQNTARKKITRSSL